VGNSAAGAYSVTFDGLASRSGMIAAQADSGQAAIRPEGEFEHG